LTNLTIISLAILKVNWDREDKRYLDNFVPIIRECIRTSSDTIISDQSLQQQLLSSFGLQLPLDVIRTLLKRVKEGGFIRQQGYNYSPNLEKLNSSEFAATQQRILKIYEDLIEKLVVFCSKHYNVTWTGADAEVALLSYIEEIQIFIVNSRFSNSVIPEVPHTEGNTKFLVAKFVKYLQENNLSGFSDLQTVVEGNMLANAIFLPGVEQPDRKFRATSVYLDTGLLMNALGYDGPAEQASTVELLSLLKETGANICCFRHTVDEIRGIFDGVIARKKSNKNEFNDYEDDYLRSSRFTVSDIELFDVQLKTNLSELNVMINDVPNFNEHEYVIDEEELERVIKRHISYSREKALLKDVKSVSAIMRLRKGECFFLVEECKAVFITTNVTLAKAVQDFYYKESNPRSITPCLTDGFLTNMLWLKKPLQAADLPRKRIIADFYAAMKPDDAFWRLYLQHIEQLEQKGQISADNVYLLRRSSEAKRTAMEVTTGDIKKLTQGSVKEIIERVEHDIQKDVRIKLEEAEVKLEEVTSKNESDRQQQVIRETNRTGNIQQRAHRYAKRINLAVTFFIFIMLCVATLYTSPFGGQKVSNPYITVIILIVTVIYLILSLGNIMLGWTVIPIMKQFEVKLAERIEKILLGLSESQ